MHKAEWRTIYKSDNPLKAFYVRWCMKEAALKADGRGVYIPLEDIHMGKDFVEIQNRQWYITFLTFNPDYFGCVATSRLYAETELIVVDPKDFV